MIDIKIIRENPELIKRNIKKKYQEEKIHLIEKIKKLDIDWRNQKIRIDKLRHERNSISKEIGRLKSQKKDVKLLLKKAAIIPKKIHEIETKAKKIQTKIQEFLIKIPNLISDKTPVGKDESQNKEIKKWGKIPKFDFKIKNHVELTESLGIADFEASGKVSGNGFYYLKRELALLNQALIRFAIDFMQKQGYEYIETPLMLNKEAIYASMDKAACEQSVYKIEDENLSLIGTSEQSLLAMHANDSIPESQLPKKYFSYSMCFRKEVGAHGINDKGLWRTHQFNKVEQFIFSKPEDSEKLYTELLDNSEKILQALKLPYRVIELCSGDLADWKHRSADLEVYRPTTETYGEVMSLSNCTEYQARKLNIKYISKKGERKILHTLNNTGLATSRILVAILENYQQSDGSIKIPLILHEYLPFKKIEAKKK